MTDYSLYSQWTDAFIKEIGPSTASEKHRREVYSFVREIIIETLSEINVTPMVFRYGSMPLMTYLPDGDVDVGFATFTPDLVLEEDDKSEIYLDKVCQRFVQLSQLPAGHTRFSICDPVTIHAEVKVMKCLVGDVAVDISANKLGGCCSYLFLESFNDWIGRDDLLKRAILLIKCWCTYESFSLGSRSGLLATYALEVLALAVAYEYTDVIKSPLDLFHRCLSYLSTFPWATHAVTVLGPVPLSEITNEPKDDGSTCNTTFNYLGNEAELRDPEILLKAGDSPEAKALRCAISEGKGLKPWALDWLMFSHKSRLQFAHIYGRYGVPAGGLGGLILPTGQSGTRLVFSKKLMNIVDPLHPLNNLGRSVSFTSYHRIVEALRMGERSLRAAMGSGDPAELGSVLFPTTLLHLRTGAVTGRGILFDNGNSNIKIAELSKGPSLSFLTSMTTVPLSGVISPQWVAVRQAANILAKASNLASLSACGNNEESCCARSIRVLNNVFVSDEFERDALWTSCSILRRYREISLCHLISNDESTNENAGKSFKGFSRFSIENPVVEVSGKSQKNTCSSRGNFEGISDACSYLNASAASCREDPSKPRSPKAPDANTIRDLLLVENDPHASNLNSSNSDSAKMLLGILNRGNSAYPEATGSALLSDYSRALTTVNNVANQEINQVIHAVYNLSMQQPQQQQIQQQHVVAHNVVFDAPSNNPTPIASKSNVSTPKLGKQRIQTSSSAASTTNNPQSNSNSNPQSNSNNSNTPASKAKSPKENSQQIHQIMQQQQQNHLQHNIQHSSPQVANPMSVSTVKTRQQRTADALALLAPLPNMFTNLAAPPSGRQKLSNAVCRSAPPMNSNSSPPVVTSASATLPQRTSEQNT